MSPPLRAPDFRNRGQTRRAYKRLIRFIRAEGLGEGEKLPPQQELWRKLGLNNSTLGGAMRMLVAAGALTRKTRVGTVIADPSRIPPVEWAVGVVTPPMPTTRSDSFFASLTVRLQGALAHQGCRCTAHTRVIVALETPLTTVPSLDADLEHGEIDGLVLLTPISPTNWRDIESRGVVLCHTPIWNEAPCGVIIDEAAMAGRAIELLAGRGVKRFAVVHVGREHDSREQAALQRGLASAGLSARDLTHLNTEPGVSGGQNIADTLLHLPETERPDGLIVFDDYVALGLTSVLREAGNYRPLIAAQTNRQLPLAFALPVVSLEVDIDELARRTTSLMLERLVNPAAEPRVEWLAPELGSETPRLARAALAR